MSKYTIETANACYTGGGIYVYWGKLDGGLWFRACDGWDSLWICDADTDIEIEETNWPEFYETHTVEDLVGDEFVAFWDEMLTNIICGGIRGNYCVSELKERFI